jgi:hypothetical protein
MNAVVDNCYVRWIGGRKAGEHQVDPRLAREREYLRSVISDLIVEERERMRRELPNWFRRAATR